MTNDMQTQTLHIGPIGCFGTQNSLDAMHAGPQRHYHEVSTLLLQNKPQQQTEQQHN